MPRVHDAAEQTPFWHNPEACEAVDDFYSSRRRFVLTLALARANLQRARKALDDTHKATPAAEHLEQWKIGVPGKGLLRSPLL
jgi:hypothetical protein